MAYIKRLIRMMFSNYFLELPIAIFYILYSILVVFPLQLSICYKTRNKVIRLLPILFYIMMTIVFLTLELKGEHWDGTPYLILALFAFYNALVSCLGLFIASRKKIEKREISTSKNTLLSIVFIFTLVCFLVISLIEIFIPLAY